MSAKSNDSGHSPKCIDTMIGAGMRIAGDIACTGVLRVQGDILGNVSCRDDPDGVLVVDSAGCVTGTVRATRVALRGRIVGPVESSRSIEVHPGATLVGDVSCRSIAIHAGGIVAGRLRPAADSDEPAPGRRAPAEAAELSAPAVYGRAPAGRPGGARKIGAAALLAIAAGAAVWLAYNSLTRSVEDAALTADSALSGAAPPPAAASGHPQSAPQAAAGNAATSPPAAAQEAAPPPAAPAAGNAEKVVTVKGTNPNRPTNVFLLIGNAPSVLYRKKRDDPTEGARIAIAEGEKASIAIAPDELVRVAQGRDVDILFQGKKVPRSVIESGAWISFAPR